MRLRVVYSFCPSREVDHAQNGLANAARAVCDQVAARCAPRHKIFDLRNGLR